VIALLVLYTAAASLLCGVAAAWAERAVLLARGAARWTWGAAIGAATLLPLVAVCRAHSPDGGRAAPGDLPALLAILAALTGGTGVPTLDAGARPAGHAVVGGAAAEWTSLDRPLAVAWALLAGLALLRLVWRAARTRHAVRAQLGAPNTRRYALGRARALVTPALGPAVLGGWRATLVLPRWAREQLDRGARRLAFAHEAEHLRAGDPRLLTAAAVLVALAPWSPAGWWMLARLRAAVEIDCDRRVLARAGRRARAPIAAYGTLLLDVATRHAMSPPSRPRLAPALAESAPTTLERRIRQMTAPRPTAARARLALLALGSLACAAAACELPRPTGPLASVTPGGASPQAADLTPGTVRAAVDPRTLAELQTPLGRTRTLFVFDSAGHVVDAVVGVRGGPTTRPRRVLRSGVRASVRMRTFAPGAVGPDSVAVAWIHVDSVRATSPGAITLIAPRVSTRGDGPLARDSILVVVDGRVVGRGDSAIQSIAPVSIRSVDVLKGAAATARFGDAGRAGAVVITRGRQELTPRR